MGRTGNISVNTNDILPIIKKWLYSEHDIFLRELVSNSCDAITKRQTLARTTNQEAPEGQVWVEFDSDEKTLTIRDNGLGMTEADVEKYIARLAFSGAEEFVKKMKETGTETKNDIIGKFGLGFYSAFMVAKKVEINSLSMEAGAKATKWVCEGETEYSFDDSSFDQVGTEIKLYLNDDSLDFANEGKLSTTLTRYCDFMPYSVFLSDSKKKEENPKAINETVPLWKKDPTTLTDADYKDFYQKLYPYESEPLFWLHLNVDHPFTLQGILYFPKFNASKPVTENSIKLYSKQVFVSDNLKSVVPEFLGLLKGAIDSTDIPLNVSRSSLQGDPNVKKISNYITKKVAEALKKLFNNDRARFETVWEDIGLFVKYGSISDEKFDEMMRDFVMFKNSEGKLVTFKDYQESIPAAYKEKMGDKIIYFEKGKSDQALRAQLLSEGLQTIETDSYIDPHYMQHLEYKKVGDKNYKFGAIDTEIENILESANVTDSDIKIKDLFQEMEIKDIEVKAYKNAKSAAYFKVDESMKRLAQMAKSMGSTNLNMPTKKTLVVNPSSPLIQNALKIWEKGNKPLVNKICHHVQDLAGISSEGLSAEEKEQFVQRSQELIQELSGYAL
ncbi:MAG: molecular chaperone HtpG [Bacteriovoracaceae bacterium]